MNGSQTQLNQQHELRKLFIRPAKFKAHLISANLQSQSFEQPKLASYFNSLYPERRPTDQQTHPTVFDIEERLPRRSNIKWPSPPNKFQNN